MPEKTTRTVGVDRQKAEGIEKAKAEGKYKGRQPDRALHEKIYQLRVVNKLSISDTAKLANVSGRTVIRVAKQWQQERKVTSTPSEETAKP